MKKAKGFGNQPAKSNNKNKAAQPAYQLGVSLMQQGDLAGAEKALREAIAKNPNHAEAYTYLAAVCRQRGSLSLPEIADLFRKAIKANPNHLEGYYNLGVILGKQGLFDEANAAYRDLLKRHPDCVEAFYNLGVNYSKQDLLPKAEECFVKVVSLKPDYAEAHYNLGLTLKQQGLLDRAKKSLQNAIDLNSNYPQAYNNLGVIYKEEGKLSEAKTAFSQAIACQKDYQQAYNNLAVILSDEGNLAEAEKVCGAALAVNPNLASIHNVLGLIYTKQGNLAAGMKACQESIKLEPNNPEAYNNLGFILAEQQRHQEAIAAYRQAVQLQPSYAEAYNNLGVSLKQEKLYQEAVEVYQKTLAIAPNYAQAYNNLGVVYKEQGLLVEATQIYHKALEIKPDYAEVYNNLSIALGEQGLTQEAAAAARKALELKPDYAEAYCNLGVILAEDWSLQEAIAAFRQTLTLNPVDARAHYNLGSILLLTGELTEGFKEYEWRWESCNTPYPQFKQPVWDGSSLVGKTILLVSEQGLGDTLQFVRYATLVSELGAKVKLACPKVLVDLLKSVKGIAEVIPVSEAETAEFDVYVPLLSLPYLLGTTLETIPNQMPYITGDKSLPNLSNLTPTPSPYKGEGSNQRENGLKVGIVWASGYRSHDLGLYFTYKKKSCDLALFLELLEIPEVTLYSLQVGKDAAEFEALLPNPRLINLSPQIKDFTDTAAFVNQLDLVIAVDTSVAHLVGGMGKPVWVLLPYFCDWRWLQSRLDTPWYPTMRLFRQTKREDWGGVFQQLKEALREVKPQPVTPKKEKLHAVPPKQEKPQSVTPSTDKREGELRGLQWQGFNKPAILQPIPDEKSRISPPRLSEERGPGGEEINQREDVRNEAADNLWQNGLLLFQQGNFPGAESYIRQAIALDNNRPEYYYHLGMSLNKQGLYAEAAEAYRGAIALKPDWDQPYNNLGVMYTKLKLYAEAEEPYRRAIALKPDWADAYYNFGITLQERGLIEEAKDIYRQAIAVNPNFAKPYNNLGSILSKEDSLDEALSLFKKAIEVQPDYVEAYSNLGYYLSRKRLFLEAEQVYRHCISLRPNDPELYFHLGIVLQDQLLLKPSEMAYRQAIALKPDHAGAHYNMASVLLFQGNLLEGLAEYEWRWRSHELTLPKISQPAWNGSNPHGKTILVVAEQGLGDILQFIRYSALLTRLGAKVKLTCPEGLVRLLARVEGVTEVIPINHTVVCDCDCFVPIMSLPYLLRTTLETIPATVPYITVDTNHLTPLPPSPHSGEGEENKITSKKVDSQVSGLKIGIVWASGMRTTDPGLFGIYQEKSTSVEMFIQLLEMPGVTLYSLQVGKDASQIEKYQDNPRVVNLSPHITNFYDTAEFVEQLDLVISVDTSVAHLVGAMGKPVWVLLPFAPDWRWFLARSDTPWYPTMRLFRQTKLGDWQRVFTEVLANLTLLMDDD